MEVGTQQWGTVAGREGGLGRQYFFYLGNNNNANGGFIHHRYMQAAIGIQAHRCVSVSTRMDHGHSDEPREPGVAKTYLNGATIQTGQ